MLLEARHLKYKYPESTQVLSFPDIVLKEQEQLLLIGKSGSGKTTLLHLLALLLPMQHGSLCYEGQNLEGSSLKQLASIRANITGIVHQKPLFVKALSCLDNIKLSSHFTSQKLDSDHLHKSAEAMGIHSLLAKLPTQLSGGEQQRMTILRAIAHKPKIIFADEPTSSLDDANCLQVLQLLQKVSDKNEASLVIVTHDNRLMKHVPQKIQL